MNIHERIKQLRIENGLSQEEFAGKIGVSRQSVIKWESGSNYPDVDNMGRICSLFGISADTLLGIEKEEKPKEEKPKEEQSKDKQQKKASAFQDKWKVFFGIAMGVIILLLVALIFTIANSNNAANSLNAPTKTPNPTSAVATFPPSSPENVEKLNFANEEFWQNLPNGLGSLTYGFNEYVSMTKTDCENVQNNLETFADCIAYFDAHNEEYCSSILFYNNVRTNGEDRGYESRIDATEMHEKLQSFNEIGFNMASVLTSYYLADDYKNSGYLVIFYNEKSGTEYDVANYFYIDGCYHVLVKNDAISYDNEKLSEKSYTHYTFSNLSDFISEFSVHKSVASRFLTIDKVYKVGGGESLYWKEVDGEYKIVGGEILK